MEQTARVPGVITGAEDGAYAGQALKIEVSLTIAIKEMPGLVIPQHTVETTRETARAVAERVAREIEAHLARHDLVLRFATEEHDGEAIGHAPAARPVAERPAYRPGPLLRALGWLHGWVHRTEAEGDDADLRGPHQA